MCRHVSLTCCREVFCIVVWGSLLSFPAPWKWSDTPPAGFFTDEPKLKLRSSDSANSRTLKNKPSYKSVKREGRGRVELGGLKHQAGPRESHEIHQVKGKWKVSTRHATRLLPPFPREKCCVTSQIRLCGRLECGGTHLFAPWSRCRDSFNFSKLYWNTRQV